MISTGNASHVETNPCPEQTVMEKVPNRARWDHTQPFAIPSKQMSSSLTLTVIVKKNNYKLYWHMANIQIT